MVLAEGVTEPREARATASDDSDLRFPYIRRGRCARSAHVFEGEGLRGSLRTTAYVVAACAALALPGTARAGGPPVPAPAVTAPVPAMVSSSPATVAAVQ